MGRMVCYGNYMKNKKNDDGSGMNVVDVENTFGKGKIQDLGARYSDRFLILEKENDDSDSEDKSD